MNNGIVIPPDLLAAFADVPFPAEEPRAGEANPSMGEDELCDETFLGRRRGEIPARELAEAYYIVFLNPAHFRYFLPELLAVAEAFPNGHMTSYLYGLLASPLRSLERYEEAIKTPPAQRAAIRASLARIQAPREGIRRDIVNALRTPWASENPEPPPKRLRYRAYAKPDTVLDLRQPGNFRFKEVERVIADDSLSLPPNFELEIVLGNADTLELHGASAGFISEILPFMPRVRSLHLKDTDLGNGPLSRHEVYRLRLENCRTSGPPVPGLEFRNLSVKLPVDPVLLAGLSSRADEIFFLGDRGPLDDAVVDAIVAAPPAHSVRLYKVAILPRQRRRIHRAVPPDWAKTYPFTPPSP